MIDVLSGIQSDLVLPSAKFELHPEVVANGSHDFLKGSTSMVSLTDSFAKSLNSYPEGRPTTLSIGLKPEVVPSKHFIRRELRHGFFPDKTASRTASSIQRW